MTTIEEEKEDYFNDQQMQFKADNSSYLSVQADGKPLNLQDFWVEDHNFFNGYSPKTAMSYAPITV